MPWRQAMLEKAKSEHSILENGDVYCFGIYSGQSLLSIASFYARNNIKVKNFICFDVFSGMPLETAEDIFQDAWQPGQFNGIKYWGMEIDEICHYVEKQVFKVFESYGQTTNIIILPGLVEETLVDSVMDQFELNQCSYVDVDFDIYSPSKYALKYLVNKGLIESGTIIGYDDWGGTPWMNYENGESRAHKEVFIDNNIDTQLIFQLGDIKNWDIKNNPHIQVGFLVK